MTPSQIPTGSTVLYKERFYTLLGHEDVGHDRCMKYHVTSTRDAHVAALYIDYAAHVRILTKPSTIYLVTAPSWDGWASD